MAISAAKMPCPILHRCRSVMRSAEPPFDSRAQRSQAFIVGLVIQQHLRGVANQAVRPARDQRRAHQAHRRVQPVGTQILAGQQGGDRQQRGQCIRQHMQVGRAQVVVVAVMPCVALLMVMVVVMVVLALLLVPTPVMMVVVAVRCGHQYPGADAIHERGRGPPQAAHCRRKWEAG